MEFAHPVCPKWSLPECNLIVVFWFTNGNNCTFSVHALITLNVPPHTVDGNSQQTAALRVAPLCCQNALPLLLHLTPPPCRLAHRMPHLLTRLWLKQPVRQLTMSWCEQYGPCTRPSKEGHPSKSLTYVVPWGWPYSLQKVGHMLTVRLEWPCGLCLAQLSNASNLS